MPWGTDITLTKHQNLINGQVLFQEKNMTSSYIYSAQQALMFLLGPVKVSTNCEDTTTGVYLVYGMYKVIKCFNIKAGRNV